MTDQSDAILVVRIEGGLIGAEAARVLDLLVDARIIGTGYHRVSFGDSLCSIYQMLTNYPGTCSTELIEFARKLNGKGFDPNRITVGSEVAYPVTRFEDYFFRVRLAPDSVPGDRERLRTLRVNWKDLIAEEMIKDEKLVQLRIKGSQLRIPVTADRVPTAIDFSLKARNQNVSTGLVRPDSGPRKGYSVGYDARKFLTLCQQRKAKRGEYGSLAKVMGGEPLPSCRPCAGAACPGTVVLIDSAVHRHPDLGGGILDTEGRDEPNAAANPGDNQECELVDQFATEEHHGTYMAGIIGAREHDFGLRGVNPRVPIVSVRWDRTTSEDSVRDRIDDLNEEALRLFVFASRWNIQAPAAAESRFLHPLARVIELTKLFLVAAAGQLEGSDGEEIGPKFVGGPMNLGDQPNVIIVTACEECEYAKVKLLSGANYSQPGRGFVHVAAPGKDIPSTASERLYAWQSGTSPATAFVAGLASAMLACNPSVYGVPGKLKERIQATSRPIVGDEGWKLSGGLVDSQLAVLDPGKDYAQLAGDRRNEVTLKGWCQNSITLINPYTGDSIEQGDISLKDVLRIVRIPASGDREQWVVYARSVKRQGAVVKIGPGTRGPVVTGPQARRQAALDQFLLKLDGRPPVSLRQIDDLLVRPSRKTVSC